MILIYAYALTLKYDLTPISTWVPQKITSSFLPVRKRVPWRQESIPEIKGTSLSAHKGGALLSAPPSPSFSLIVGFWKLVVIACTAILLIIMDVFDTYLDTLLKA